MEVLGGAWHKSSKVTALVYYTIHKAPESWLSSLGTLYLALY
jgi:hypothetical protein